MISPDTQALLDLATPRPWAVDPASTCDFGGDLQGSEGEWGVNVGATFDPEDAALIVAAVNDYERLLTVEAERDTLREALYRIAEFSACHSGSDGQPVLLAALYRIVEECESVDEQLERDGIGGAS